MPKPSIRHIAIFAGDTEKLAAFYVRVFEMELIHNTGPGKAQYLSDGHVTLAILPHRLEGSAPRGLNHFGFSIEDQATIFARLSEEGVQEPKMRPADRPYAEYRAVDLEGNWFDLSEHGYVEAETAAERAEA
jgi:catechol 2,3-dioxygenase-like lactoylglutathione lyase family enzyme